MPEPYGLRTKPPERGMLVSETIKLFLTSIQVFYLDVNLGIYVDHVVLMIYGFKFSFGER